MTIKHCKKCGYNKLSWNNKSGFCWECKTLNKKMEIEVEKH